LCETVTEALLFFFLDSVVGVDFPFLDVLFESNLRRRYPVGERKNESTILDRSPFVVVFAPPVDVEVEAKEGLLRGRKCEEKGSEEGVSVGEDGYDEESEVGEEGESR
jgi:hypothetical protein